MLLAAMLGIPAVSQTISGYSESAPAMNSSDDTSSKVKRLEYPGNPVEGLQALLRPPTNRFQIGSNIVVEVVIKNVSPNELSFPAAFPLLANGFDVHLLNRDKTEVPLTSLGKAQQSSGGASPNVFRSISPHGEMVFTLELHKLYQLESPGVYSVQVTKSLPSPDKVTKAQLATGVAQITLHPTQDVKKN